MDKVEFLEEYFGIKLLDCQKEIVKKMLDEKETLYVLPARHAGRSNYLKTLEAILKWNELNESKSS